MTRKRERQKGEKNTKGRKKKNTLYQILYMPDCKKKFISIFSVIIYYR